MSKLKSLRFCGVEGVDVSHPTMLMQGRSVVLGKTFDAESGGYIISEPSLVNLDPAELSYWGSFLAKCVKLGQLKCADKATADCLEVPFSEPSKTEPKKKEG